MLMEAPNPPLSTPTPTKLTIKAEPFMWENLSLGGHQL